MYRNRNFYYYLCFLVLCVCFIVILSYINNYASTAEEFYIQTCWYNDHIIMYKIIYDLYCDEIFTELLNQWQKYAFLIFISIDKKKNITKCNIILYRVHFNLYLWLRGSSKWHILRTMVTVLFFFFCFF